MSAIINFIASILGFLMDLFFRGLTLIGYPRLWACIILFAATTRFLFLRQRIRSYRGKILTPYANKELLDADPHFFEKTKDTETKIERAALKKQVYKKYKISGGSGCLTAIIQYPLLVALFSVVKNPQKFIPSLDALYKTAPEVNTFLGTSLSSAPLSTFRAGGSILLLGVPLLVMAFNVIKMFPTLRQAKTKPQILKSWGLCAAFTVLIGWFSASLPLAISLYWLTNDVTLLIFDCFIHKYVPKSKFVVTAIENFRRDRKTASNVDSQAEMLNPAKDLEPESVENDSEEATTLSR